MADARIERLIAFLKKIVFFACFWPLRSTATRFQKTCNMIFRFLSALHASIMIVTIIYTMYVEQSNPFRILKLGCELLIAVQAPLHIFCFTIQYDNLQYVVYEFEDYCKWAKPEEVIVFHRYIDRCKSIYMGLMFIMTLLTVLLCIGPLLRHNSFPIDVKYSFSVEYLPLKIIIYLHHVLLTYQTYTQLCANIFIGILLWFVSARCDILSEKFRKLTKFSEFRACVKEHQEILQYGDKVVKSIRHVIFVSFMISTLNIIFSGCTFLSRQPLSVKSTFVVSFLVSFAKVYLCTLPADHMITSFTNIAHAVYDSQWYNSKFQKNLIHVLFCSQRPIVINISGLLPTVSLNYYATFVSTTFSYLTTLRAFLKNDEE